MANVNIEVDLRALLPDCPLAYEVPHIPATHTALVIAINAADIDWQAKMLPWTLASLINNTDLIMNGVHLKITSDKGWVNEIVETALKRFDLPQHTCIITCGRPEDPFLRAQEYGYDAICMHDINCWAFRDESNTHKLNFSGLQIIKPYPPISELSSSPTMYDMTHCTAEQFRHAIKQLMGAQLSMKV